MICDLKETSLLKAYEQLTTFLHHLRSYKTKDHRQRLFKDPDYFPCWYCLNMFKKVNWLEKFTESAWHSEIWHINGMKEDTYRAAI